MQAQLLFQTFIGPYLSATVGLRNQVDDRRKVFIMVFFNSSLCLSGNRILGKHLGILSVHQTMHQPNGLRHMTLQTVRDFVPAELCPMGNWS